MADVTGTIGNEYVELNNAATEATLKLLLQATLAASKGSTEEVKKIAALAGKAGLDSASIERANVSVRQTSPEISKLGKAATTAGIALGSIKGEIDVISQLTKKIAAGDAQASDLYKAMGSLPGPLGLVATGFGKLAEYQEGLLKTYQDLSRTGVNFGGSLTDMRLAAANSRLTLQEFSDLIKQNSPTFAKLGGTAEEGAKAFSKASKALLDGEYADQLRALGLTAKDMNQGMLDYIEITGRSNRTGLRDTAAMTAGTAAYLTELDILAQVTGKTREEQEKALKEAAANAAWQAYLDTLNPEEADKAAQGLQEALAKGGKGAGDFFQATAMGLPVQTKAGQEYVTQARNMADVTKQQALSVKNSTVTLDDMRKAGVKYSVAAAEDMNNLKQVGAARIMSGAAGAETMSMIFKSGTQAVRQGTDTLNGANKARADAEKNVTDRLNSQAGDASKTQGAMQDLSKSVNELAATFMNAFFPIINSIIQTMVEYKGTVVAVVGALLALKAASTVKSTVGQARELFGGSGGAGAPTSGGAGGALGSAADGLGKVGPAVSKLGTGFGNAFKGIMTGIAGGLRAFANPAVAIGAVGFGAAIAAIGAGIAAASWLTGKALPTLSEGMKSLENLDGDKLGNNAKGMALIGGSLLTFVPFGVTGLPAAYATGVLADNLTKLAAVDPAKLERTAAAMQKVKDATPSIGQSISQGVSGLFGKVFGNNETPSTAPTAASAPTSSSTENLLTEVQRLNSVSREILTYIKENADYAKQNVDAVKALNGNLF